MNQLVVESTNHPRPRSPVTEKPSGDDSLDEELGQKYLRKSRTPLSPTFTMIAAFKDYKKRWNFEFDNGQVWRQLEPRYLPRLDLPVQVKISKGVLGSYDLRAVRFGKPVKVKRLN